MTVKEPNSDAQAKTHLQFSNQLWENSYERQQPIRHLIEKKLGLKYLICWAIAIDINTQDSFHWGSKPICNFYLFFFCITALIYFLNIGDLQQNRMVPNTSTIILWRNRTSSEKLEIMQNWNQLSWMRISARQVGLSDSYCGCTLNQNTF